MEYLCKITLFSVLFATSMQIGEASWIIEKIPHRRYSPKAYALTQKNAAEVILDLSRKIWTDRFLAYQDDKGKNQIETNDVFKSQRISQEQEEKTQTTTETEDITCDEVETFSPDGGIPCNLNKKQTPMFVYFSFDDAITSWNIQFYRILFEEGLNNPNGCPIRATFFNSHDNTQYDLLKELYDLGHEIGSHSISHKGPSTWWSVNATESDWVHEIVGQKDNIHEMTDELRGDGIPLEHIRGMRAPFLAIGGDKQFQMLEENGFLYDSSIPNDNQDPSWPFTLHDPAVMNGPICRSPYCPKEPHKVWEAVMNVYYLDSEDGTKAPCSMLDGCRPGGDRSGAYQFLMKNFERHYQHKNKVPFGINMHAAWFAFNGYVEGMADFIKDVLTYDDVYIVPIYQVIEWMKNPKTLKSLKTSRFGCKE